MQKNNRKLSDLTERELLDLNELANIVYLYYDNLAKANNGNYGSMLEYVENEKLRKQYSTVKSSIFDEIKKRVDNIDYEKNMA